MNKIYPIASMVTAQVAREETDAVCKSEAFHFETLVIPVADVAIPTTPAIRENITKNPVAMFPTGKYIGNKWAGGDNVDATNPHASRDLKD